MLSPTELITLIVLFCFVLIDYLFVFVFEYNHLEIEISEDPISAHVSSFQGHLHNHHCKDGAESNLRLLFY